MTAPTSEPFSSRSRSGPTDAHPGPAGSGWQLRISFAIVIVLLTVVSYFNRGHVNTVTGQNQHVDMKVKDEIIMGLQAIDALGPRSINHHAQQHVDRVGALLVTALQKQLSTENAGIPYPFDFHLLADDNNANLFAIPGGQIFLTDGFYQRLGEGQLAATLAHAMGHVLERHGTQLLATEGNASAPNVAGEQLNSSRAKAWVERLISIKYSPQAELEADRIAVQLLVTAGFSPDHLVSLIDGLAESAKNGQPLAISSAHSWPGNAQKYVDQIVSEKFPGGLPTTLQ